MTDVTHVTEPGARPDAGGRTIVVVGASLGGLRAVEALRRLGWHEGVVVIGDEPYMPYSRPPLSKRMLTAGGGSIDDVLLKQKPSEHPTRWLLGATAVASDLTARTVTLADGTAVAYDGLVIATGVRARRLPLPGAAAHRRTLRTVDDSAAVEAALLPDARIVIIGAGFIGCEAAVMARKRGCEVAVVAADQAPMQVPLGTMVGAELKRRHEAAGISFHLGRTVASFVDNNSGAPSPVTVLLDDGTRLDADLVIEAVGSSPSTTWLQDNGLDLSDGVLCDGRMKVEGAGVGVVAVGDVARFPHALLGGAARRIEHLHVPGDSATLAAATLLAGLDGTDADVAPYATVPTFWSSQGEASIRSFGSPGLADESVVLEGDLTGEVAIGYRRAGALVAIVLLGMTAQSGRILGEVSAALRESVAAP